VGAPDSGATKEQRNLPRCWALAPRPLRYFISTRAIELAESIPGGLEGSVSGPNQSIQPVPTKSGPELWQLIRFSPCSNPSCTEASWKLGSILSPRISQMPPSQKIIRMVLMGTTMPPLQSEARFVWKDLKHPSGLLLPRLIADHHRT
jgi:hypothetical protein